jgi:HEAT repeat protein
VRRRLYIVGAVAVAALIVAAVVLPRQLRQWRLLADLHDPSPAVRAAAVRSWDASLDVDLLVPALNDEHVDVRMLAVMQLGERWYRQPVPQGEKRASVLVEALKDQRACVRQAAAEGLGWLWPDSESVLIAALKDADARVRAGAAHALRYVRDAKWEREMTPEQSRRLRALLRDLLHDEDPEVRRNAAERLDSLP